MAFVDAELAQALEASNSAILCRPTQIDHRGAHAREFAT